MRNDRIRRVRNRSRIESDERHRRLSPRACCQITAPGETDLIEHSAGCAELIFGPIDLGVGIPAQALNDDVAILIVERGNPE